jgi:hypothetical protein
MGILTTLAARSQLKRLQRSMGTSLPLYIIGIALDLVVIGCEDRLLLLLTFARLVSFQCLDNAANSLRIYRASPCRSPHSCNTQAMVCISYFPRHNRKPPAFYSHVLNKARQIPARFIFTKAYGNIAELPIEFTHFRDLLRMRAAIKRNGRPGPTVKLD